MRRRVFVAESAESNRSLGGGLDHLVGEAGADLEMGCISVSESKEGNSSETVLLGPRKNLGKGNELGGGEFEYAGPAQRSEKWNFPSSKLTLIGIGAVLLLC